MAGTVPPGVSGDQCDNDACGHASADQVVCGPTEGDGAMPPGGKRTAGPTPVEALTHDDKRVNIPTADARDFVDDAASTPGRLLYPRDTSLDPQLVCGAGRTRRTLPI